MTDPHPLRTVAYLRVSTEDQAQAGTIEAQRTKLQQWAELQDLEILHWYVDDGVSGTLPLTERSAGVDLLRAAQNGMLDRVVVYKLDRLGRSLKVLLQAHDALAAETVTVTSASEPFDTSTHIGRFLFQLLSSLAELERENILERTRNGRERVVAAGKWVGGPCPYGYTVDDQGRLVEDTETIPGMETTRANVVRHLFDTVAGGRTSCVNEARLLTSLGVPTSRRYGSGKLAEARGVGWHPSVVRYIIRNPVYMGTPHVPALVDPEVWNQANRAIDAGRRKPKTKARTYLLSGVIACGDCGKTYVGHTIPSGAYYQCNTQTGSVYRAQGHKCRAKLVPVEWLDDLVWQRIRETLSNPSEALDQAQVALEARVVDHSTDATQIRMYRTALAAADQERERIMLLFRKGRMREAELDRALDGLADDVAGVKALLAPLERRAQIHAVSEESREEAETALTRLSGQLDAMEAAGTKAMQAAVAALGTAVRIKTTGAGRHKRAHITITFDLLEAGRADSALADSACLAESDRTSLPVAHQATHGRDR